MSANRIDQKPEKPAPMVCMYHPEKAPQGQVFTADDAPKDGEAGWVDTPAKFKKKA